MSAEAIKSNGDELSVLLEAPDQLPSDWKSTSIGEAFDIGAGNSVTPARRHGPKQHPFLRTSNVFWGSLDLSTVDTMHYEDHELATKTLRKGDLLVCEGGDIGRAAIWDGSIEKCGFQNHLHRLRPRTDDVIPRFVMYVLEAGFTMSNAYEGAGNKTTIPNLSSNRLAALEIVLPPKPEQAKVAAVLWRVQRAVELEGKLVRTARELKAATLRHVFTCGLRGEPTKETELGPLPDSWGVRPFAELREWLQYGTSAKCDYSEKGYAVLRIPNIAGGRIQTHDIKRCEMSDEAAASLMLADGDIVFIRTNGVRERVGSCSVYHGQPERSLFASYLIRARPNLDLLDPDFFQYYSETTCCTELLSGRASPAADGKFNINQQNIDGVLVPVPHDLDEQREIARQLAVVDTKIALHERKRDTLRALFRTLLRDLLTARRRVHELPIDVSEVAAA